ncbi:uncharacterized protein Z519_09728 [Cladophialophora bantiana CBS 173.52]|uniref:Uncharacterized protein n=1 Tax=Cladophialophora bantiana (strain ATCC 10958 / CBS 173.52 / CDC B-1940 / NIH 8579) TaxID=1442370 RepID=A0A0D2FSP2_CLAB1|nr:uncharacterized protein Z519_09728 [Cladophialophora bantiana CBS 173.52]KIW89572.1 hypothetical protein Z519_09728 [Cladophialophora bantiana CBS 173.52]
MANRGMGFEGLAAKAGAMNFDPLTSSNGNNNLILLQVNNYRLPQEIILQIVSCFVSEAGLCFSNSPDYDADVSTIRALLKTTLSIKRELLRRILAKPLHIYITSGKN